MAQRFFDNTGVASPYSDPNQAPASVLYLREAEPEAIWAERDNHIHRFLDEDGKWNYMDLGATDEEIKAAILALHPVGSYYYSFAATSPASLFGGIWTQIDDTRMDLDDGGTAGRIGGNESIVLDSSYYPSHSHTYGNHSHSMTNHSHTLPSHLHSFSHHHTWTHNHTYGTLNNYAVTNNQIHYENLGAQGYPIIQSPWTDLSGKIVTSGPASSWSGPTWASANRSSFTTGSAIGHA